MAAQGETLDDQPLRRTNTSAYYRSMEKKRRRYTPSAEELADDQDIKGDSSDEDEIVTGREKHEDEPVEEPMEEPVEERKKSGLLDDDIPVSDRGSIAPKADVRDSAAAAPGIAEIEDRI